jgi:trk system potassium uptake protein TrkH
MFLSTVRFFTKNNFVKTVLVSYLLYVLVSWIVLQLPICHIQNISALDNLFTAISATSTTGLATVDIGTTYSFLGQLIILLIVQAGGIGYMTLNTFIVLSTASKLSSCKKNWISATFSLPPEFNIRQFLVHSVLFTLFCELVGALYLSVFFFQKGIEHYVWNGVFHSVSAFCTAGLSLFSDSFTNFRGDFGVNFGLFTLSILGAVGFITWLDLYKRLTKRTAKLIFTTKVILWVTLGFLVLGTFTFMLSENRSLSGPLYEQVLSSFFQVMTASTTVGFHTIDIGTLKPFSVFLLIFLMIFGASPSGTGGGLKSTAFTALIGLVKSAFKRDAVVSIWKRTIPARRVYLASVIFLYYASLLMLSVCILVALEKKSFVALVFEVASAVGTVGLSMGITSSLSEAGKILISMLMFMGKIGILTFGIAIASQDIQDRKTQKL